MDIDKITKIIELSDSISAKYFSGGHFVVTAIEKEYEFSFDVFRSCNDKSMDLWALCVYDCQNEKILYRKTLDENYDHEKIGNLYYKYFSNVVKK